MSSTTQASSGGIGFCGLLTIVFIVLKLLGKIDWGWIWVLSPLWIPLGMVLGVFLIVGIGIVVVQILKHRRT